MSNITEKLEYLKDTKRLIKETLIQSGQPVSDTDTFRSYVDKIKALGGSSADVRYVTFMNGDTELYKKPVAVGDDCADVVTRGLISTPTKESTVQYDYTYSGWSFTDGDIASSAALKSVNADRTVYAAYTEAVRYYTITFYDEDGTTVLATKQVAYGTVPSYTPTKDGYDFDAWTPTPVAVTGDTSYTVSWKLKATFETATWEQIAQICDSGQAADYFNIGDAKPVTLTYDDGTSETINFRIVDMGVDPLEASDATITKKAPLTIMADNIVSISPTPLASAYNKQDSLLHRSDTASEFLNRIYTAMPSELQSVIKPYKYYSFFNYYTNIFVAHAVNLGVSHSDYGNPDNPITQGRYAGKYKYFNTATIKRTKLTDSTFDNYWTSAKVLQSGSSTVSYSFLVIDGANRMSVAQSSSAASHGIVPCFCI